MLDQIVNDVLGFENLAYLNASPYEHVNFTIKKFIKMELKI